MMRPQTFKQYRSILQDTWYSIGSMYCQDIMPEFPLGFENRKARFLWKLKNRARRILLRMEAERLANTKDFRDAFFESLDMDIE